MQTGPYLSIAKQIRSKVDLVKHIDLYNGQYLERNDRNEIPFNRPAVFIEYGNVKWVEQGQGVQEGDTYILLHCVTDALRDTRNIDLETVPDRLAKRLKGLAFDDDVHEAVQQFEPDDCIREMWRTEDVYAWNHDGLLVNILVYSTRRQQVIDKPRRRAVSVNELIASGQLKKKLTDDIQQPEIPTS